MSKTEVEGNGEVCAIGYHDLKAHHDMHHMGIDRSLFLARRVFPRVSRDDMKRVVRSCKRCQSIDPAPVTHNGNDLSVSEDWMRLAIDVTHYHQLPYLSIVDCGPGRFAIWRKLNRETADAITEILEEIFLERGPVKEVLMDNGRAFHSEQMARLLGRWNIRALYRAAYRPSGNGIVERHHRTVKTIAERGKISPREAVYWYNASPRNGLDADSVPQRAVYRYQWRESPELRGFDTKKLKIFNFDLKHFSLE